MNLFFTSDEHYGHRNIITYCNRPFADVVEMREALIANHNAVVPNSRDSVTIHLGDMFWNTVTYEEATATIHRLNGTHAYVLGNHDKLFGKGLLGGCFADIVDVRMLRVNGRKIWLSHYAHRVWPEASKGSYHLFGHSHGALPPHGRSFDVGVDSWGYTPLSFDYIDTLMQAIPVPASERE